MAIEESHPLALVPDLFDQLTTRERQRALALWEAKYQDANRLVHPNTKRRAPETIARRAILAAVARTYTPWLQLSAIVFVVTAGLAVDAGWPWTLLTAVVGSTVALVILRRWRRRHRDVTFYFAQHFPRGGPALPQVRRGVNGR